MNGAPGYRSTRNLRLGIGLGFTFLGLFLFILGANPALFGQDRSSVFGFIQISVFLIGLGLICLGGFITLNTLWNGSQKSISADIGLRLVSTGVVIAVASGFADIIGFGTQTSPAIPYFGQWQTIGVIIGECFMIVGFLMMIPVTDRPNPVVNLEENPS
jgi:hypothetical protein